jgi:uncharacterized protein
VIVEGEHRFAGSREAVWQLLLDPEVIAKTVPGTQAMALVAAGRYEGKMRVGLGPLVAAEFDVTVTLADVVEPERYTMRIEGLGRLGRISGSTLVRLEAEAAGTLLRFRGNLEVGGRVAALGQRLLDSVSRVLAKQGLEAMEREVERRLAPATGRES